MMNSQEFVKAVEGEFSKHSGPGMHAVQIDWDKLFQLIQAILPFVLQYFKPKV